MRTKHLTVSLIVLALMLLAGCTPDEHEQESSADTRNDNANPGSGYARLLEIPRLDSRHPFITHTTNYGGREAVTYSLEYDEAMHHSRWVAFEWYDVLTEKHWWRSNWYNTSWGGDPFQQDPQLDASVCPDRSYFSGSGGVRGHICASEDRVYSRDANEQTFYYSNMTPMYYDFNGGFWADLEIAVRDAWAYKQTFCDTLYVVKGGTIREGEYRLSNNGKLPIPNHYWMALLCRKNGTYKSLGFWVEHTTAPTQTILGCAVSIDQLEAYTGIDFFCNLPDKVEDAVEATCYPAVWGLR
ncbi:MAG: DNA/RNA non-specific endonuclease [Bacteroidaceae bacterium]|nr:DNA/RNA non-specific endonuclease [Bacteroidaceae bacterium]